MQTTTATLGAVSAAPMSVTAAIVRTAGHLSARATGVEPPCDPRAARSYVPVSTASMRRTAAR